MSFTQIEYEARGHVRVMRFARPEKRNCIGSVTHHKLIEAPLQ
ncbi:hypothetical protein [Pseudomonas gingeri]|nr:hypothetical protein [Pseudomonas gingeri]